MTAEAPLILLDLTASAEFHSAPWTLRKWKPQDPGGPQTWQWTWQGTAQWETSVLDSQSPLWGPSHCHHTLWLGYREAMCNRRKCIYKSISPRRWFHLFFGCFLAAPPRFPGVIGIRNTFSSFFRQDSKCELDGAIPTTDLPYFLAQCPSLQP